MRTSNPSDGSNRANRALRGVGIGLRRPHFDELRTVFTVTDDHCSTQAPEASEILLPDWFEFVPENFVGRGGAYADALELAASRRPLVAHGVSLSLGGPDPLDLAYIDQLGALLDAHQVSLYSDHICWAQAGEHGFYDLLPLPWTARAADWIGARAAEVARRLGRPIALENITHYAKMPGGELDEGEFLRRVLDRAGAGLRLDLNNVYVNAHNHGRDPLESLLELPLERTRYVHLAGHGVDGQRLIDTHDHPIADGVWRLYEAFSAAQGPCPTLIEWDAKIPELARVCAEAERARRITRGHTVQMATATATRSGSSRASAEGLA